MSLTVAPADMVLFAVVAREGSFTKAASALGITKQSVSERITRLERQLQVRLLERTTRSLRLTQPGAAYFERCQSIAADIEQANAEVQRTRAEPVGLVRIASPSLYGRHFLMPSVCRFLAAFPKATVELVLADRRVNLVEEGLDLAIVIGAMRDSSLVARKLGDAEMCLVASPKFLARVGKPNVKSLRDWRCIGFAPLEEWTVRGVTARVEPVLVVNDHEAARTAALAGVGFARLPRFLCDDALRTGKLELITGATLPLRSIQVVHASRSQPVVVRQFLDQLS